MLNLSKRGPQPNVVPPGEPGFVAESRPVAIGWHPVPGGGWLAETALGQLVSKKINHYPDPTQHWAILVGDYCHQLWMVCYAHGVSIEFWLLLTIYRMKILISST